VRFVYDQLFVERQDIKAGKKVIHKEMVVDNNDILLIEAPEMSVVETVAVKRALSRAAVV
jgi:hypothetical protein